MLNALLIANICVNIIINSHLRTRLCWQEQSCLTHQHQKAKCFHGNGFTASIRACYQQHGKFFTQSNINRYYLVCWQKWMASRQQLSYSILTNNRLCGLHFISQSRLGKGKINLSHDFAIVHKLYIVFANLLRGLPQNPLHLMALRSRKLFNIIVKIYHSHWLNKQGGAGGRLVVDNTWYALAILLLYWQYISIPTHGNDIFLKIFLIFIVVQKPCQMIFDFDLANLDFPTNPPQLYAGIISKIAMLVYNMLQIQLQLAQNLQIAGPAFQNRSLHFQLLEKPLNFPHGIHGSQNIQQLCRVQNSP